MVSFIFVTILMLFWAAFNSSLSFVCLFFVISCFYFCDSCFTFAAIFAGNGIIYFCLSTAYSAL